jgi:ethanolamine utilization protein EutN
VRIGEVIGKVTLSQAHPSLRGATWILTVPLAAEGLRGNAAGRHEPIAVYDELGAAPGMRIAISEGPEASAPFHPEEKPIDAYNAAILDTIDID